MPHFLSILVIANGNGGNIRSKEESGLPSFGTYYGRGSITSGRAAKTNDNVLAVIEHSITTDLQIVYSSAQTMEWMSVLSVTEDRNWSMATSQTRANCVMGMMPYSEYSLSGLVGSSSVTYVRLHTTLRNNGIFGHL